MTIVDWFVYISVALFLLKEATSSVKKKTKNKNVIRSKNDIRCSLGHISGGTLPSSKQIAILNGEKVIIENHWCKRCKSTFIDITNIPTEEEIELYEIAKEMITKKSEIKELLGKHNEEG